MPTPLQRPARKSELWEGLSLVAPEFAESGIAGIAYPESLPIPFWAGTICCLRDGSDRRWAMAPKKKRRPTKKSSDNPVEARSPFDDAAFTRRVVEAATKAGPKVKDQRAFIKQLRHQEFGYSAEAECAAILAWLGNCVVVHPLDQNFYARNDPGEVLVPDLLAVFSLDGEQLPVLIEVKSTDRLYVRCSDAYRAKLLRYGQLVGMPVLLAWRPRKFGRWLLVDLASDEIAVDGLIRLPQAMMHNLMGLIAGDFMVDPEPGIGLNLRCQVLHKKKLGRRTSSVKARIEEAYIGTRTKKMEGLSASSMALIFASASEEYTEQSEGNLLHGWLTPEPGPEQGGTVFMQDLLRMLLGWSKEKSERIAWRGVLDQMEHVKAKKKMEKELTDDIGKAVRYVFHQQPKQVPSFIPRSWLSKTTKTHK